jgi:hypothetical protein
MTGVMLSQGVALVPLLTMHGHVHHVDGASTMLGSPWLPILHEGSTCPSREAKIYRGGSSAFDDTIGLGRGGEISPETPIVPEASPQGSGEIEFAVHAFERMTRCQCFLGPLRWASKHARCRILPPLGYLGYFDT